MNDNLSIRVTTKEYRPAIVTILRSTPEFKPSEVVVAEEVLDSYLHSPLDSGYFSNVVKLNSSIVGYVCFGPTPCTEGTWDLYWLVVERNYQGKGIGKYLLSYVEERIEKAQGRLIIIETSSTPEYDKTRKFYRTNGYELVCQIDDFYTPGDHKIVFRKKIK
jgi:ribosomal protein S18 acetylase RimI-like enzyme